ncbi:DUF202 domain-containing protein [Microbacterium foliorum]|uniref:DUF202 domain-containing protein n=1 Tax=Microbacterium foliorum TaxID=104336 RepID=A0A0F0KEJ5_9MICO|nr:DUF202 domain-containing protein [Microbacterium foliorum]AXL11188.1 DUF202 domain-containing protein [Microbacterium foliorum]KJL19273.1 hypothetical protein RN50_02558 [Microbacterium foliorum]
MTESTLFDPGLQPERTELAWRRTALAIAVCSLLSLRVLPVALPAPAAAFGVIPGLLGLLAACAIWMAARRRQTRLTAFLTGTSSRTPHGGGLLISVAVLAVAFGAAAILFVTISVLT